MLLQNLLTGFLILLGVNPSAHMSASPLGELSQQRNPTSAETSIQDLTVPEQSALYSHVVTALSKVDRCTNVLQLNAKYLVFGHGAYLKGVESPRKPIPAYLEVVSVYSPNQKTYFYTQDAVIDLEIIGSTLYVLTPSGLEEWDLSSQQRKAIYETYALSRPMLYKEHASGMALYKQKLIISHGRLGFSVFDTHKKRLVFQSRLLDSQRPLESQAVDVAIYQGKAIILVDSFSLVPDYLPPSFRGFVVLDADKMSVQKTVSGLDPGSTSIAVMNDQALVSFGGMPYWKFSISQIFNLQKGQSLEPQNRIWKFATKGHPTGKPAVLGSFLLTCYKKPPLQSGVGAFYTSSPEILDIKSW